jgi:hypothetical protein
MAPAPKMYLPPAGQSRRSFLKRGLVGGAVLALGGGTALFLRPGKEWALPAEGLQVLSPREYAVVMALAERMVPTGADWPSLDAMKVGVNADQILSRAQESSIKEMKQLLNLFENALPNLLFGGRLSPFTQMSGPEQDEVLKEWAFSRLSIRRTGYTALHNLVVAGYFVKPETWPAAGYPGPPKGFHDPNAPVWKGNGQPRPPSAGIWVEPT